jgi:hypothetical protein
MRGRKLERECSYARLTVWYCIKALPQLKSFKKCTPSNIVTTAMDMTIVF